MKYTIQFDLDPPTVIEADSLAHVCNQVRGKAERITVWSPSGLLVIDTKFGDQYEIARKQS